MAGNTTPEQRLAELGFTLPRPMNTGNLPFDLVRLDGDRIFLSGHVPLADDGSIAKPLGKVGSDLTAEQGQAAAQRTALG
ncbi:MAG: RidA family protein, partial [Gammaproteobacteria bacterium]|nr:RidA family protein [Gammaproteobacteria bacterium]